MLKNSGGQSKSVLWFIFLAIQRPEAYIENWMNPRKSLLLRMTSAFHIWSLDIQQFYKEVQS